MKCRHCGADLENIFLDLYNCPPSNALVAEDQLNNPELFMPLKTFFCTECRLVTVDPIFDEHNIFNNFYTYFSSFSESWLQHSENYVDMIIDKFSISKNAKIIEIASNDGYLLQYFLERGYDVLGIDPAANAALVAEKKGIKTIVDFFNTEFAENQLLKKGITGDLIIGNNVLAHVPDINDFVNGLKKALSPNGIITMEFPHLLNLVTKTEFDTIYHEHYSYFSFFTVNKIFQAVGLKIFDVEEISTHGGSLRIYAKHAENDSVKITDRLKNMIKKELSAGIDTDEFYDHFSDKVFKIKLDFLDFLIRANKEGKKVVAYAAAAKGNTFLNYCGIKGNDLIKFVADTSTVKQGKYLPGSHIPVLSPEKIKEFKPDYIIILAWNIKEEITRKLEYVKEWGAKFVIFIPSFQLI